jgi:hypothetical protein
MATQRITNFMTLTLSHTPTLDTSAYAQNDVLFDFEALTLGAGGSQARPVRGTINNFILLDKDDNGNQITVFFSDDSDATLGTFNGAVGITDAHAATILGQVDTGATYEDLVGCKSITPSAFSPIPFESTDDKLYVGGVLRGSATPTHTAAGITIRIGITIE